MKHFNTVEDYLEVIAGKRDLATGLMRPTGWFGTVEFKPLVSLARYDVSFLDSVTDATVGGNALTDRQAELALKIVHKYQKQLHAHGISIPEPGMEKYRKPLRVIDRSRIADVVEDRIALKFPYDQNLIDSIRANAKESQGRVVFSRDEKQWVIGLTEYNVNWVCAFAKANQFTVTPALERLMESIIECEQTDYRIELIRNADGTYAITNADESLLAFIEERGGFGADRQVWLCDNAGVLGYTISDSVRASLEEEVGASNTLLITNSKYELQTGASEDNLDRVFAYAEVADRWPVVVFDPTHSFEYYHNKFAPEQILDISKKRDAELAITSEHKVILSNRAVKHMKRIPLLLSHIGLIAGQDKRIMTDSSEKTVYVNYKLGR